MKALGGATDLLLRLATYTGETVGQAPQQSNTDLSRMDTRHSTCALLFNINITSALLADLRNIWDGVDGVDRVVYNFELTCGVECFATYHSERIPVKQIVLQS